jgi:hypothetical protein
MKSIVLPALLATGLSVGPAALAHHSFAMFDANKTMTVKGVVKEFQWTNPHSWIELEVKNKGKVQNWSFETSSPLNLKRNGWTKQSLKPGDTVSVSFHPRKDGGLGGSVVSVTTADGKTLSPMSVG